MYRTTRARIFLKIAFCFVLTLTLLVFGTCSVGSAGELEPINGGSGPIEQPVIPEKDFFQGPLKVMTLNIAHGRKTAFSQMFLSWQTIYQNLGDIAGVLKTTAPDIVALQEADGPSWWSGDFDHVALLAGKAVYPWHSLAAYMDKWGLQYGAALLARRPYLETRACRFAASWPTPAKGFSMGRFGWFPQGPDKRKPVFVDVISVHLDFSRETIRTRQIDELRAALAGRKGPQIIMGDFNSRWFTDESVVRTMNRRSGLQVYRPEASDLGTYGSGRYRYDWILISADLRFISYRVMPTLISDHLAVVAKIGMKP